MRSKSAFVGTFHKTGTVLLGKILGELHNRGHIQLWRSDWNALEPESWMVNFHYHSAFMFGEAFGRIPHAARILISVRDPRDLLVSATRYHVDSKEEWLREPREKFGGLTYQEKINSLVTWEQQLHFELEHSTGNMIKRMSEVPLGDARVMCVKLEDLMVDYDLGLFRKMFVHIGMKEDLLEEALSCAYRNSLFANSKSRHSRGGFAGEWKDKLPQSVMAKLDQRFSGIVEKLGYES
jgi:hypothetical protein